ncbi:hypothetical protein ASPZODRAFT_132230 [Penicilliopsis zonata CBS 506.65]|uniref:Beta-lactamase-related domain-containing protein n=1 Tax=Penicilliopsis zonata CBS 506.65 TaxID=1073090 RepID=A0A1L9SJC4_9EURO|nr:hypothetical protein ASPZODRAFT_132230 [Penicilliopsis zonata CBS 506.65]OJJ47255.1 hypothetical protein ASPZODRAFT_132230 [Penicilliopsis zonata CBS 506.65]
MVSQTVSEPRLLSKGVAHLQAAVDKLSSKFPGCFLVLTSPEEVLFNYQSGPLDVLSRETSSPVDENTIIWLSSATRFIVSLAYLQLVDRGLIELDTPMRKFSPELEEVSKRVLRGFDNDGQPIFEPSTGNITLRQMLNGTSGFDAEHTAAVNQWKAIPGNDRGLLNSCKAESLIYTPPCTQPGEVWRYGPNNDWLSYIFPAVAHQDLEEYLQQNIFHPLGIQSASFYPHDSPDLVGRVMPLRWLANKTADGQLQFEEWTGQQAVHFLPKGRKNIEYPTGGAGLYSTATGMALILQNILAGFLHETNSRPLPTGFTPLLSPTQYRLILSPDLELSQLAGMEGVLNGYFDLSKEEGDRFLTVENVNCNLGGLPMITGKDRKGGWGRRPGSAGWGGAAGTDFYIDPATGIAVFYSTQLLPGSGPVVKGSKKIIERAVFEALEMD